MVKLPIVHNGRTITASHHLVPFNTPMVKQFLLSFSRFLPKVVNQVVTIRTNDSRVTHPMTLANVKKIGIFNLFCNFIVLTNITGKQLHLDRNGRTTRISMARKGNTLNLASLGNFSHPLNGIATVTMGIRTFIALTTHIGFNRLSVASGKNFIVVHVLPLLLFVVPFYIP